MNSNLLKLAPVGLALLVQACASVTTGPNQSLSVNTGEVQGAKCKLSNDKGTWYVPSTPGSVTVNRAYGDLSVLCEKDTLQGNTIVSSSTKGMAFGNILAGGIIGAAVDAGTGSAYDYPTDITVQLGDTSSSKVAS